MKHYYLLWTYHDLYLREFYNKFELDNYINSLTQEYKNDPDFKYRVIYGEDLEDIRYE